MKTIKSSQQIYDRNIAILKDFSGMKKKITVCKTLRQCGWEEETRKSSTRGVNAEKLDCNIARARSKVFEYAWCNDFTHFITLTIDPKRWPREDLKAWYSAFSQWFRDYRKKYGFEVGYLFIPELHEDSKSWHVHGLVMGIPDEHFCVNEHGYLDWPAYREKFGWVSLDKLRNKEACSKYITKYISKNLSSCVKQFNAKLYYCSKGLKTATIVKKGPLNCNFSSPDWENDFVAVKWYNGDVPLSAISKLIR